MNEKLDSSEQMVLQNKYDNKKQWEKELSEMGVQIKNLEKVIKFTDEQKQLLLANSKLVVIPENFKILNPTWKFETIPEYLDNLRRLNEISSELKDMEVEMALFQRNAEMARIVKSRDDLQKMYEGLCVEIESMEKKGD